jgi:hypothetical protein
MGTLASRLARWRAFSPAQRLAFVQAWCLLPLVWLGLRVWKLPRLHAWLAAGTKALPAPTATQVAEARAVGDAVNAAARHTLFPEYVPDPLSAAVHERYRRHFSLQ